MKSVNRAVCICLGSLLLACQGRTELEQKLPRSSEPKGYIATLNLAAGAPESPLSDGFFPAPAHHSYPALIRSISRLQTDNKLKGVLIKARSETFPFAQADELGELLHGFAARKIPVVCHIHELDNASYWLMRRGCSELWVSAAGSVPTVGIGAQLSYVKGALDKVGVQFDMLAMGRYKSGGEALTRTSPSEDALRNLRDTLGDLREQWLRGVTAGQANSGLLAEAVEDGPYSPAQALELGVVDRVGFEDEAAAAAIELAHTDNMQDVFGPGKESETDSPLAELVRMLSGAKDRKSGEARIALVPALGSITMSAEGPFGGGSGITATAMTRTIKRLRMDDSVRAIVLRMDSPGGSPLASDLIWREVMLARAQKPVIVSIAGMSASGGYYIASAATKIVASRTAIVGSIGVFGGKVVINQALENLGISTYTVPASPNEGAESRSQHLSPLTPWDDATRERVHETMSAIYTLFIERVAVGRGMDPSAVRKTAEGEIFLAQTGVERGLVDEIGGLSHAIELARKTAQLGPDTPVVLEGAQETLFETLFLGSEPEAQEVRAALERFETARLASVARFALGNGMLDQLRPYRAVLSPLLSGEAVVVALPFAVELR